MSAPQCGLGLAEQYLLGMLSLLAAMLRLTVEELTPSLPLRAEVCEALQGAVNRERILLAWLECHEQGDWESCDRIAEANGVSREQLMQCYSDSVIWAGAALRA